MLSRKDYELEEYFENQKRICNFELPFYERNETVSSHC